MECIEVQHPQAAKECVDKIFANEGCLNITLETVYGHAVKKLMLPQGENVVQFFPKRRASLAVVPVGFTPRLCVEECGLAFVSIACAV